MTKHLLVSVALLTSLITAPAQASFHLWRFSEIFSNADGSVQFIEMLDGSNNEQFVGGMQLKSTTNTFNIPANLPSSSTANHRMLFATSGFGLLAGGVTPDYIIPAHFFNPVGDTLNFANVDIQTFGAIPLDGVTSRALPGTGTGINSPTNFANAAGSVNLAVPEPAVGGMAMAALVLGLFRRRPFA